MSVRILLEKIMLPMFPSSKWYWISFESVDVYIHISVCCNCMSMNDDMWNCIECFLIAYFQDPFYYLFLRACVSMPHNERMCYFVIQYIFDAYISIEMFKANSFLCYAYIGGKPLSEPMLGYCYLDLKVQTSMKLLS